MERFPPSSHTVSLNFKLCIYVHVHAHSFISLGYYMCFIYKCQSLHHLPWCLCSCGVVCKSPNPQEGVSVIWDFYLIHSRSLPLINCFKSVWIERGHDLRCSECLWFVKPCQKYYTATSASYSFIHTRECVLIIKNHKDWLLLWLKGVSVYFTVSVYPFLVLNPIFIHFFNVLALLFGCFVKMKEEIRQKVHQCKLKSY